MRSNVNGPTAPATLAVQPTADRLDVDALDHGRTVLGSVATDASDRAPARKRSAAARVAGERRERQLGRPTPVTLPQLTAARLTPELGLAASIIIPPPT